MITNQNNFRSRFPGLSEGMHVYSADGEKLGTVLQLADDSITVQKGFFFPKDFTFRYDDIQDVRDGSAILSLTSAELADWHDESHSGWRKAEDINAGRVQPEPREEYRERYANVERDTPSPSSNDQGQVKVPLMEEELEASKTMRQRGEVKVRKVVHTEMRHFTIPVMREEFHVERTPASEVEESSQVKADAFREETINIPLMEEEVTVSKRPVVREEVNISRERTQEERTIEGEVRKEEVQIEGEDEMKKRKIA